MNIDPSVIDTMSQKNNTKKNPNLTKVTSALELREYKKRFVSVKRMQVLKLPHLFPFPLGEGRRAAI